MIESGSLATVADDALLSRVSQLCADSRSVEAELVAHLAEVDARRLYAREACPSMFVYCVERLHFSEAEAYLRIAAARASRRHPALLAMLGDGRLHLSGIERLAPHLTAENRDAVLARAARKSRRQIEELVAELQPRPDVIASIRKLPGRSSHDRPTAERAGERAGGRDPIEQPRASSATAQQKTEATASSVDRGSPFGGVPPAAELRPDGVPATGRLVIHASLNDGRRSASVEPVSPDRYKVQFTASRALRTSSSACAR